MSNIVESRPPNDTTSKAILLLCLLIGGGSIVYYLFNQIKWQQINNASNLFFQHNWGWIVGIPALVFFTFTMHLWVPLLWRGYKTWHTHRHDHLDRVEYRKFLSKATEKLDEGYNTKFVNSKTGDVIEISNPYIASRISPVNVKEEMLPQLPPPQENTPPMRSGRDLLLDGTVEKMLKSGYLIIGFLRNGQLKMIEIQLFFSVIIGGVPSSGKTTTVLWILIQQILHGARLILVDPHLHYQSTDGRKSLAQELAMFANSFIFPPCDNNAQDIMKRIQWMRTELKRRQQPGYMVGSQPDVIMVFDEFNTTIEDEEITVELGDSLAHIQREGRKFGVHTMLIGHRWARQDIGNVKIRTCASTVAAHRFNDEGQGKLLLGGSNGKKVLELEPGWYWMNGIMTGYMDLVKTPYLSYTDMPLVQDIYGRSTTLPDAQYINAIPNKMEDLHERRTGPLREQQAMRFYSSATQKIQSVVPSEMESDTQSINSSEKNTVPLGGKLSEPTFPFDRDKLKKVQNLLREKRSQQDIVSEVWQVQPSTRAFNTAVSEYREMLAYLISLAQGDKHEG